MSDKQGVSDDLTDAGRPADDDKSESPRVSTAEVADACDSADERACSTIDVRVPLLCQAGRWEPQAACRQTERCESAQGTQLGACVPIAPECLNHVPGKEFCDGEVVRSCADLVLSKPRRCEERRRCMEVSGSAQCVCARGWIDDGSGAGCQVPTSCANQNGGCDEHTQCSSSNGIRVCSACPPGYKGDGESGCYPQLSTLELDPGTTLTPSFSPDIYSYRVVLPLLRQSVRVTASAPPDVGIVINDGEQPAPASGWQSPPLPLGEHKVEISVRTRIGLESKYELLIERTGGQQAYVKASDPDADDELGSSVALWGDTLVVGVAAEDSSNTSSDQVNNSAEGSGAVYVFVRSGATWTLQQYLKADPPRAGDYFGVSVAIHEDMLVVGAPGASPVAASTPHGGSVHVFKRTGGQWSLIDELAPANTGVQDMFGQSLALSGERLVVGAPFENAGAGFSGSVYVFERSGDGFGEPRRIIATPTVPSGLFGWSLALEENSLVVGSPQYNFLSPSNTGPGIAYVFGANNAEWTQLQELTPPPSLEDGATFGWSVDIEGNALAVGAPRARSSNVGQGPGDAFVYERASGGAWGLQQPLRAAVPRASDWYGFVVKLSAATLLVGSVGDASGAAGLSGDPNNDAARDSGAIFMYGRDRDEWVRTAFIKASNPDTLDYFASSIAVYGDTLVATSPGEGSDAPGLNGNQASNTLPFAGAAYVFQ